MTDDPEIETVAQSFGIGIASYLRGKSADEIEEFIGTLHYTIQHGGFALVPVEGGVN